MNVLQRALVSIPVALLCSLAFWSCFSVGRWEQLPAADQEVFQRCAEIMRPTLCGPDNDLVYRTNCMRSNMGRYAETPPDGRHEWLLAHGCPPSMVTPGAYLSSGGAAPSRVAPSPPSPPPSARAPGPPEVPDRIAVRLVMEEVQRRAAACLPLGVHRVRLTYGSDGNVILVTPAADPVTDAVLACVREMARVVPLPPFSRPDFTVDYPFTHM